MASGGRKVNLRLLFGLLIPIAPGYPGIVLAPDNPLPAFFRRFCHAETIDMPGAMPRKDTMRAFGLDEFDLDRHWPRLIDPGNTATGHRFESEQCHGVCAMPMSCR
jgi:hypothetical protein